MRILHKQEDQTLATLGKNSLWGTYRQQVSGHASRWHLKHNGILGRALSPYESASACVACLQVWDHKVLGPAFGPVDRALIDQYGQDRGRI